MQERKSGDLLVPYHPLFQRRPTGFVLCSIMCPVQCSKNETEAPYSLASSLPPRPRFLRVVSSLNVETDHSRTVTCKTKRDLHLGNANGSGCSLESAEARARPQSPRRQTADAHAGRARTRWFHRDSRRVSSFGLETSQSHITVVDLDVTCTLCH